MTPDQNAVARTIWGEMRSNGYEGMVAVASVIMNRVSVAQKYIAVHTKPHPLFGDGTPESVCKMPYQFSCWLPDDSNLPKLLTVTTDDPQFAQACEIAEDCTQFNWLDMTNGAMWYYSGDNMPNWAIGKNPCLTIGNTRYYNNIN